MRTYAAMLPAMAIVAATRGGRSWSRIAGQRSLAFKHSPGRGMDMTSRRRHFDLPHFMGVGGNPTRRPGNRPTSGTGSRLKHHVTARRHCDRRDVRGIQWSFFLAA